MTDPALPLPHIGKETLIPAIICAGVSVFLGSILFLNLFFLVPLGVCAIVFGPVAAWLGFALALLGSVVVSLGEFLKQQQSSIFNMNMATAIGTNILWFSISAGGFIWVILGSLPIPGIPPVRTVFRFIGTAVASMLVILVLGAYLLSNESFSALLHSMIEESGAQYATPPAPDRVIELSLMIALRGGALIVAFFMLFLNWQTAFLVSRLFRARMAGRERGGLVRDLIGFHVPRQTIWLLIISLAAVLLCQVISVNFFEIAAWNLLVICVIMFFAQGGGIVLFHFVRRVSRSQPMPLLTRLCYIALLVFLIFTPGINIAALGLLVLLGIAESWLPLRTIKQDMPAS